MTRRTRYGVRTYAPLAILKPNDCRKIRNGNDPTYMFMLGYDVGKVEGNRKYERLRAELDALVDAIDEGREADYIAEQLAPELGDEAEAWLAGYTEGNE